MTTTRKCWVGEPTFRCRALIRKAEWCSSVKWRCLTDDFFKIYSILFLQTINPAKINFNHLMWYCQMVISTAVKVIIQLHMQFDKSYTQPVGWYRWWSFWSEIKISLCRGARISWTSRGWWSSRTWKEPAPTTSHSSTFPSWRSWSLWWRFRSEYHTKDVYKNVTTDSLADETESGTHPEHAGILREHAQHHPGFYFFKSHINLCSRVKFTIIFGHWCQGLYWSLARSAVNLRSLVAR